MPDVDSRDIEDDRLSEKSEGGAAHAYGAPALTLARAQPSGRLSMMPNGDPPTVMLWGMDED